MRQRSLFLFFLIAFGITWTILFAEVAALHGWIPFHVPAPLLFLAGFGPMLSALALAAAAGGRAALRRLLAPLRPPRPGWSWYAFALLGMPALFGAAVLFATLTGASVDFSQPPVLQLVGDAPVSPWLLLFPLALYLFVTLLGEEVGWRGYALPRLLSGHSPLAASIILGVLWGAWHLPMIFVPEIGAAVTHIPLGLFLVDIVGASFIYTWLYLRSGRNLFLVVVLHASNNLGAMYIPLLPGAAGDMRPFLANLALKWLFVFALLAFERRVAWTAVAAHRPQTNS